ncbi:uncharacterized protein LOC135108176 [Scylla paramamosain]|uniref:uncharacterized protein LOC135108176 n=1 Tax=Scylla paramamosain TaxID=85552 RepID=UPI0030832003
MRAMMAVQSGRAAGASHPSRRANYQEAADRSKKALVHLWRGQLRVGSVDVGAATLWSEYMTCIPALGQILKMTRVAKYEDLWHKVLQSRPCRLSKRRPVTIRGRIITVHTLSVHGTLVEQLVAELREAAKPLILTCQLLNDKNYVEVVLVPPCPELEQCGLYGSWEQLHILLVGRRSNTRIANLHKLLRVVDLSQISDLCTQSKTAEDKGLEDSLHHCEGSDVPEVKGSTSEVSSCLCDIINLTASTDELAEKRECLDVHGADPCLCDEAEVSDNKHFGANTSKVALVNSDADQSISTRIKKPVNQTEDMRSESREESIEMVAKTEAQKTCGSLEKMPWMDQPAHQTEMRHSENNNTERGVEHSTEDDGVEEFESHSEKDKEIRENEKAADIPEDNFKTQSTENTKDRKLGASKDTKKSRKWKLSRFIKTQKLVRDGQDLCGKRKCSKHLRTQKTMKVTQDRQEKEQDRDHSKIWPTMKTTQDLHEKEEHREHLKIHKTVGNTQDLWEGGQYKEHLKLLKVRENMQDLKGKEQYGDNSFKRSELSKSHLVNSTDLHNNLHNDEKLRKTACVVIQRQSLEKMVHEAKEKLGMHIKAPKVLQVKRNGMLDTKKLRDLFSLSDSNKPDLIKPSMLRSNREYVIVNPLSVEEGGHCEPKTSSTPDILKCLEKKNEEKRNQIDAKKASDCHATSDLVKETPENNMSNSMIKRQKTAVGENCSLSVEKEKKRGNIVSKKNLRECVENSPCCSLGNTNESHLPDQKKEQHLPATDLDNYPGSEQAQEVKDRGLCTAAKQTSELNRNVSLISDNRQASGLEKDRVLFPHPKHRWKLAYRQMLNSSGGDLSHTVVQNTKFQHQYEKHCSGSGAKSSKKRKLNCEWIKAMENFHPRKRCHWIDLPSTKDDSSNQMREASATMASSSLVAPGAGDISAGKPGSEESSSRSETVHTDEDIEVSSSSRGQGRSKHQQQVNEEDMNCLQHSESSHQEPHEVLLQSQREAGERCPSGQCSTSQDCQYSSPSCQGPGQPQLPEPQTDLTGDCMPLPFSVEGVAYEAEFSLEQKLPDGAEKLPDILCGKGDKAELCEGQVHKDPVNLHQEGNTWMKECNKTKESQEHNTDCDSTSVHCAFNEAPPKMNSPYDEQCAPQSKQDSAGDSVLSVVVTNVTPPLGDDSRSYEKCVYSSKNLSPEFILTGRSQALETDLPCPKALARRIKSNLKNCMLRLHSSFKDDLSMKHECLPVMQASMNTFFIVTQKAAQQPDHSSTQKSLSSERKSPGIKKVLFERILKKMKLQLLKDANVTNNMDQCHLSNGLKKLSSFIEGQGASALQVKDMLDTQHTTMMKDLGESHHLSPHLAKSLIAQVAELNHPYKINSVQSLYVTTCRTQVDSGLCRGKIVQNPQEQEMATSSDLTACSFPSETGQYCLPAPLKKCLPQETPLPSPASDSIRAQPVHLKTPGGIGRAVFVPNELYQPLWKNMPFQAPLIWKEDSKYIHLFQGKQQDVIKLKCLLVARKKSYGILKEVEFFGGHVLAHHSVLDQLLASPDLPQLCASSSVSFGVYGSLAQVMEGKVAVVLGGKCLLLVHHTALLDPNTGAVLQAVSSSGLHLALVPAHTLYMCAYLLGQQLRTAADEKLKETLTQNLRYFKKCVEVGTGHILGGSRGSACAVLSPQSPITEYLACLRTVHRCLDFAHRHTAVVIGEGVKKTASCHQPSIYKLCAAREVLQVLLKVTS